MVVVSTRDTTVSTLTLWARTRRQRQLKRSFDHRVLRPRPQSTLTKYIGTRDTLESFLFHRQGKANTLQLHSALFDGDSASINNTIAHSQTMKHVDGGASLPILRAVVATAISESSEMRRCERKSIQELEIVMIARTPRKHLLGQNTTFALSLPTARIKELTPTRRHAGGEEVVASLEGVLSSIKGLKNGRASPPPAPWPERPRLRRRLRPGHGRRLGRGRRRRGRRG